MCQDTRGDVAFLVRGYARLHVHLRYCFVLPELQGYPRHLHLLWCARERRRRFRRSAHRCFRARRGRRRRRRRCRWQRRLSNSRRWFYSGLGVLCTTRDGAREVFGLHFLSFHHPKRRSRSVLGVLFPVSFRRRHYRHRLRQPAPAFVHDHVRPLTPRRVPGNCVVSNATHRQDGARE